jgi:Uma2 family endonuclease
MSTVTPQRAVPGRNGVPLLVNGDRMTQPEFHRRYLACPEHERWELIGGVVYLTSPLRWGHGTYHQKLSLVLGVYQVATPGIEVGDSATVILDEESEPQPDLSLRILAEYGGQSRMDEDGYVQGAPELVVEVAYSSRSIDFNQKRKAYEQAGVPEYLVLSVEDQELFWFHFLSGSTIRPNRRGVSRSLVAPGLWIDNQALVDQNGARLMEVVQQGLASREHAAFVRRLRAAYRRRS